jgi:hypothetical protein
MVPIVYLLLPIVICHIINDILKVMVPIVYCMNVVYFYYSRKYPDWMREMHQTFIGSPGGPRVKKPFWLQVR